MSVHSYTFPEHFEGPGYLGSVSLSPLKLVLSPILIIPYGPVTVWVVLKAGLGTAKNSWKNDRSAYVLRYSCPAKVVGESRKGSKGRSSKRPPKVKGSRERWLPHRISQAKGP